MKVDVEKLKNAVCENCGLKFELNGIYTCSGTCGIIETIEAEAKKENE